jgi:hypothetical protein
MLLYYLFSFGLGVLTVLVIQYYSRQGTKRPTDIPPESYIGQSVSKALAEQQQQQQQQQVKQTTTTTPTTATPTNSHQTSEPTHTRQHSAPPQATQPLQTPAVHGVSSSPISDSTSWISPRISDNRKVESLPSTPTSLRGDKAPNSPPEANRKSRLTDNPRSKSGSFFFTTSGSSLGKYFAPSNVLMKGWLEIRAISMVWNKRFFILYTDESQGWISYFKNEQMKRADCYGHIKVKNCTVRTSKSSFEIINMVNRCIFSVDGPPTLATPASTSHRIFRLSATDCILRAPDARCLDEWVRYIESAVKMAPMGLKEEDDDEAEIPNELELVNAAEELHYGASGAGAQLLVDAPESSPSPIIEASSSPSGDVAADTSSGNIGVPPLPEIQRTEVELKAIRQLQSMIPELIEERNIDEGMLCRFAKARAYEPKATIEMLTGYFAWRDEYKPENIEPTQISSEITKQKAGFFGFDRLNRPVLVVWAVRHLPKESDVETFMRFIIYVIEQAIAHMASPVYQFTAIVDLKDWGTSNFDMQTTKVSSLYSFTSVRYCPSLSYSDSSFLFPSLGCGSHVASLLP